MGLNVYLSGGQVCAVASTDCWLGLSAKRKMQRKCINRELRNRHIKNKEDTKSKSSNFIIFQDIEGKKEQIAGGMQE